MTESPNSTLQRREPWLIAALPCRGAYPTPDGDFLAEVTWGIAADRYPARHGPLRLYTRWAGGQGEFTLSTRILDEAGTLLAAVDGLSQQAESQLVLVDSGDPTQPAGIATAVHEFPNLVFPAPGRYWIHVALDGALVVRVPFWAVQALRMKAEG
jgi:hypothetical protein